MQTTEIIVQFLVIGGFGIWAYSTVKGQSIKDTLEQIKDLLGINKNG